LEVISEFPKNEKQLSIKFKIMMNLPFWLWSDDQPSLSIKKCTARGTVHVYFSQHKRAAPDGLPCVA
jgi:hypothetical protein